MAKVAAEINTATIGFQFDWTRFLRMPSRKITSSFNGPTTQSNNKQKNNSSSMSSSLSDREDTQNVAAFDSSSYSPKDQNLGKNKISASDVGVNDSEHQGNESGLRTGRAHGNIGVTTSQQMLQAEWDVAKLNIYEEAADLFLNEFCIYVY